MTQKTLALHHNFRAFSTLKTREIGIGHTIGAIRRTDACGSNFDNLVNIETGYHSPPNVPSGVT